MQVKTVTLKCANCGGALQIGASVSQLACGYCGSTQQVIREGGSISLELMDSLSKVSQSADRAAAEMAIVRLSKERTTLQEVDRPGAEAEGLEKIKAVRGKFNASLIGAVFIPVLLGLVTGGMMGTEKSINFMLLVGLAAAVAAVAAVFVYRWPQSTQQIKEINQETAKKLSAIDSRLAEIDASVEQNKKIVK